MRLTDKRANIIVGIDWETFDDTEEKILQIEYINDVWVAEVIKRYYLDEQQTNTPTMARSVPVNHFPDVEEYLRTTLLKDPKGIYSNHTLAEIFYGYQYKDQKAVEWVNWAVQSMLNSYIKPRVEYLKKFFDSPESKNYIIP